MLLGAPLTPRAARWRRGQGAVWNPVLIDVHERLVAAREARVLLTSECTSRCSRGKRSGQVHGRVIIHHDWRSGYA